MKLFSDRSSSSDKAARTEITLRYSRGEKIPLLSIRVNIRTSIYPSFFALMTVQDMLGMVLSFANFVAAFKDFFESGSVLSLRARVLSRSVNTPRRVT